jgi:hypothetical protein
MRITPGQVLGRVGNRYTPLMLDDVKEAHHGLKTDPRADRG